MRNTIRIFIEGKRADLDESSFVLLNYTAEDLTNPTIVRNSFSKQITLKGTPRNDDIFGHIYRNDRDTVYGSPYIGANFDPCRKTQFVIYNEMNEILESGYLKLDGVELNHKSHSYKVTLYGGLGSFLYGLSYDANGDKLTLADLDYGETLDFTINNTAVADAWARIGGDTSKAAKWDILNFIPGYHGLPPSPFDANKCLVTTWRTGLKQRSDDGVYNAVDTIVTLNEKVTGNAARDYRSYLQKPCIKMSAIIDAICDPNNNGGWTVNKDSGFFAASNPYWVDAWMTLPSLYELNINETQSINTQTMSDFFTRLPIVGGGGSGMYGVTVHITPYVNVSGLPYQDYAMYCANGNGISVNMLKITLRLYDSSLNEIATATYNITTYRGVGYGGDAPSPDFTFDHIDGNGKFVDENGTQVSFPLYIEAQGAAYYQADMAVENYYTGMVSSYPGNLWDRMWEVGETTFAANYAFGPYINANDTPVDIIGTSSSTVRTGASITKAALLGGGKTPADYLLSYCKLFGIEFVCHRDEKVIDLIWRKNFYNGGTVDLSGRIDRGRPMEKSPFAFDARWYVFGNEAVGEFASYYQNRYTRPFGQFRVNTGYEFDASERSMTDDIVFGNLCSVVEASPYYCKMRLNNKNIPSVFLAGGKYLLYNGSDTQSVDLPTFADAGKVWDNTSYPMHDAFDKLQLHNENDAHLDERDTLVFFGGMENTTLMRLSLTDDTETMLLLNGNNPCWLPNYYEADASCRIDAMPHFARYKWSGGAVTYSLDWGDPKELQVPGATIAPNSNIFDQYWKKYIGDRYDDDSAVVVCYVDLRGMQVGDALLRQFYAFDGAIWALNRIIDYSITTSGPTKCEFVKVQDTTNYSTL